MAFKLCCVICRAQVSLRALPHNTDVLFAVAYRILRGLRSADEEG
jgi:hypothetical protein